MWLRLIKRRRQREIVLQRHSIRLAEGEVGGGGRGSDAR